MTHTASRVAAADLQSSGDIPPPEYRDADRLLRIFSELHELEQFSDHDRLTDEELGRVAAAAARLSGACCAELRGRLHRTRDWRRA